MRYAYSLLVFLLSILVTYSQAKPKYTIAVIPKSTNHIYWDYVHVGAKQAAKELNINISWAGPRDESQSQVGYVQRMLESNISALVIAPNHQSNLVPITEQLVASGVKVVLIDSGMDGSGYSSFIATDNYQAGSQAGEYLAKLLNQQGHIMLLRYKQGNSSTMLREQGFLDTMKKYPGLTLVYDDYVGTSVGSTYHTLLRVFKNIPKVDGIFAPNESSTTGLIRALKKKGLSSKVKTVGFDISQELAKAIKRGKLNGTMLQQPIEIGYLGVKQAYEILENKAKTNKEKIFTEAILITRKNINSKDIKPLLYISSKKGKSNHANTEDLLAKFFVLLRLLYQRGQ
ncbi:substrate-binding domain-containing protein [Spartinivicinus poritis]|uniref:Substrate-binding domain-containing protein n=1 Tax=Spartinivicinus poritis TaxID=2994640 RepID=A0ABT5UAV5_9GAMM|nr:substrate-binding domain-containing protein [Spartinivicinus sp. A2-2]MDE1462254.1 substrate-binding domain-containing protein [Spartinivicinus sp. A2-2]